MAKPKPPEPIGDPNDPQGMIVMFNMFLDSMRRQELLRPDHFPSGLLWQAIHPLVRGAGH